MTVPLTRVSLLKGKTHQYHRALMEQVYLAMRETFDVPADDRFMTVSEHDRGQFDFGADYLGIHRSDDLVQIQITANNTRTLAQKKALFADIASRLAAEPGVRPEDVLISLVEVSKKNWSFGNGEAQYAPQTESQ
jgi:phenylpyruvate tautomerase PptA (4-oxalocrotonate tautomerase family)